MVARRPDRISLQPIHAAVCLYQEFSSLEWGPRDLPSGPLHLLLSLPDTTAITQLPGCLTSFHPQISASISSLWRAPFRLLLSFSIQSFFSLMTLSNIAI